MYSRDRGSGRVTKQKAYLFAAIFSFIILILLVVFNLRPEAIQTIVRQLIGSPK